MRAARFALLAAALGSAACGRLTPEAAESDADPLVDGAVDETFDAADSDSATSDTDVPVDSDGAASDGDAKSLAESPIDPKLLEGIKGKLAILGTHWRPVGGPKVYPEPDGALATLGDTVFLSTTHGLRKWTPTGWFLVTSRPCAFAPSANGALLCVGSATFDRFDGTTWTTHACPGGACKGSLVETGSGAFLLVDGASFKRRAPGSTTWSDIPGVYGACTGTMSAAGARVTTGTCYSLDDGLTFTWLSDANVARATSAGIVFTKPSGTGVSLLTTAGVTTTLSEKATLFASGAKVVAKTESTTPGAAATFRVSTDGGQTWAVRPSLVGTGGWSEYCLSSKLIAFNGRRIEIKGGWRIDEVFLSTDDGVTVTKITAPRISTAFRGAYREGTKDLFTADLEPTIIDKMRLHRSTDGGATWTPVPFKFGGYYYEGGYGGDFSLLLFASPGGHVFGGSAQSFSRFDDATLAFPDKPGGSERTVSAAAGKLFLPSSRRFSTDDGATWSAGTPPDFSRIGGLDATGVAWSEEVGPWYSSKPTIAIQRSDDGLSWVSTGEIAGTLFGVALDRTLYGRVRPLMELHRSTDHGVTWSPLPSFADGVPTLLPLGGSSTLVIVVTTPDKGFAVQMSNDGATTFVDRTLDLPARPDSFFAGNGHVWATVPDHGMFELVP